MPSVLPPSAPGTLVHLAYPLSDTFHFLQNGYSEHSPAPSAGFLLPRYYNILSFFRDLRGFWARASAEATGLQSDPITFAQKKGRRYAPLPPAIVQYRLAGAGFLRGIWVSRALEKLEIFLSRLNYIVGCFLFQSMPHGVGQCFNTILLLSLFHLTSPAGSSRVQVAAPGSMRPWPALPSYLCPRCSCC